MTTVLMTVRHALGLSVPVSGRPEIVCKPQSLPLEFLHVRSRADFADRRVGPVHGRSMMAGSVIIQSDDVIVLLSCLPTPGSRSPALQLVHFIQHRKRPTPASDVRPGPSLV